MRGETVEEGLGLGIADRLAQGADEADERGVGGGHADVAERPVGVRKVEHGGGQGGLAHAVGVEGEYADASGHADPAAGGIPVAGVDEVKVGLRELGELRLEDAD